MSIAPMPAGLLLATGMAATCGPLFADHPTTGSVDPDPVFDAEGTGEIGYVTVCLGTTATTDQPGYGERAWEGSFAVVDEAAWDGDTDGFNDTLGSLHRCSTGTLQRVLTLRDDDGQTWWVGWGIEGNDDAVLSGALDLDVGQTIQARLESNQDFAVSAGVILTDDEGLVFALQDGVWGTPLADDELPGLTVEVEAEAAVVEATGCGERAHYPLHFVGDETVSLLPISGASVQVDGVPMTAVAAASYDYPGETTCTDMGGSWHWAVWR